MSAYQVLLYPSDDVKQTSDFSKTIRTCISSFSLCVCLAQVCGLLLQTWRIFDKLNLFFDLLDKYGLFSSHSQSVLENEDHDQDLGMSIIPTTIEICGEVQNDALLMRKGTCVCIHCILG